MRLLFPNGEHAPVELAEGTQIVGSSVDSHVVLTAPGVALQHCELTTRGGRTMAVPRDGGAATVLNGKQIRAETALKPGDLLLFARVGCRVVASAAAGPVNTSGSTAVNGENERTRVRMALPKFVLRGVSGPTFGKTQGVVGTITLGRSSECDICIPSDEISRRHARLKVDPEGVAVEDLDSANGTFVNNQRVHETARLKPGDELRLDTVRFLLMSPGMETHAAPAPAAAEPAQDPAASKVWIVIAGLVLIVALVGLLAYFGILQ